MTRTNAVRAVVFDLDNTLVESQIDYHQMKLDVLDELVRWGVDPALLDGSKTIVENVKKGKEQLAEKNPDLDLSMVDRCINALLTVRELERIETARAHPGAYSALRAVETAGLLTALLTRGSREYALKVLMITGLDGTTGPCVCRDDYPLEEAKPNPLAMRRVAAKLGLEPVDCLYIGDHPMDLECARASGAGFVAVTTGSTDRQKWSRNGCRTIIDSVADLPSLLERLRDGADDI